MFDLNWTLDPWVHPSGSGLVRTIGGMPRLDGHRSAMHRCLHPETLLGACSWICKPFALPGRQRDVVVVFENCGDGMV